MKISDNGLNLIKKFEGCRLTAYQDAVGVWTIGYGTTNADKAITGTTICQGLKISQATADDWLRQSVDRKYGPKVDKYSAYNWNQNEFDALVSFAYNIGSIDGLTAKGSRSKEEIADKILAYNRAGGNGAGFMAHDVWYQYKGSWYYLGSDGAMLKGLQTIKGKWYYLDQDGRMATEPVILTPDQDGALHYPGLAK